MRWFSHNRHIQLYFLAIQVHYIPSWCTLTSKYRYTAYTPHPQSDVIQLNAPDYDPDIDGDLDPATDVQPPNAQSNKEDTSADTPKPEDHTTIPLITSRPEHQPSEALPDIDRTEYHNVKQPRVEHPSDYHPNWKTS